MEKSSAAFPASQEHGQEALRQTTAEPTQANEMEQLSMQGESAVTQGAGLFVLCAQAVSGACAALAFRVRLVENGPHGRCACAFVLYTRDGGASWQPLPLLQSAYSKLRFRGFPVWPPESIDALDYNRGQLVLHFRDEYVPWESGGESLWRARISVDGLAHIERIGFLDYAKHDLPGFAPAIAPRLPAHIQAPDPSRTSALAWYLANQVAPPPAPAWRSWLFSLVGAAGLVWLKPPWWAWVALSCCVGLAAWLGCRRLRQRTKRELERGYTKPLSL